MVGVEIQPLAADRFACEHPEVARAAGPRLRLVTGDALEALAPGQVEGAVIAGVSAMTIAAMLRRAPDVLASLAWIVLCPTRFNGVVRPALTAAGLFCADEELVTDRGRTYEIIVARPGVEPNSDPIAQAFGPRLVEGRHPALPAYLESVRRKMAPAFASGLSSYGRDARPAAAALGDKLALLDAAIARVSPQGPE